MLRSSVYLCAIWLISLWSASCRREETSAVALPEPSRAPPPSGTAFYAETFSKTPNVADETALGRKMFFDPTLSASGRMACATCHDPKFAYGPAGKSAVELGGSDLERSGFRAVPSLRYQQNVPPFSEHYFDEAVDESTDQGPTGGRTWDGRANSAHDQALLPLMSPFEMANANADDVVRKVESGRYAADVRRVFGNDVFANRKTGFKAILMSLEIFQQSPKDFYPYNSKYDAWLRGEGKLSEQESHGLALFTDEKKGNCAQCHPSQIRQGAFPQFTDFGFVALGVPRNREIPSNADPGFYDLGLCGPERKDLADRPEFCGLFRAPTLRNVALRHSFFHNGAFHDLRRVVEFYAERDLNPEKWYSKNAKGGVQIYDDVPEQYRKNVNAEPPLDRKAGDKPALSSAEIDDLVAFLRTLTDADLKQNGENNH
jgi:cytochrome c peroxidase